MVLIFCQGEKTNWSKANSYCISKGTRLPFFAETNYSNPSGGVPSCDYLTWTANTVDNRNLWIWYGSNYDFGGGSFSIRCVK